MKNEDTNQPNRELPSRRPQATLLWFQSVSGRSGEQSATRCYCSVGASAAYGACSDFPVAMGTDSSGELFGNGDANWVSDVSEAKK
ncbi:hypothetical protein RYX36_022691 [Vicia faba]